MAFRADEKAEEGFEHALQYLVTKKLRPEDREKSEDKLRDLIMEHGPVVHAYPCWHPLVSSSPDSEGIKLYPVTTPCDDSGYRGLDHTIYLRNAFITCPYELNESIFKSVDRLKHNPIADITAEELDVPFYMPTAKPILVKCKWKRLMATDGTIPKAVAVPLLLEQIVPLWRSWTAAETWETMRAYFVGEPMGSRSSLFVNQETGQMLKTLYNTLIYTGMFGPIYVA